MAKRLVSTAAPADRSVTNPEGVKLEMTFYNDNQTAMFVLNGKLIQLKQDTLASGIQYRNANYVYQEHQGQISLTNDGKADFRVQK